MVEVADLDGRAAHCPALWRLQVGVVEVTEAGRILGRLAINGQRVLRCSVCAGGARQQGEGGEHQCGENQSHCQPWNREIDKRKLYARGASVASRICN